jgi:hypothetical protein
MPRERTPLTRPKKQNIIININDIFRNSDIQNEVIKNLKKIK